MSILAHTPARVKSDRQARPFGEGILDVPTTGERAAEIRRFVGFAPVPPAARRMPFTAADLAFERARSLSLDAGFALPPSADVAAADEIEVWHAGAAAAGDEIAADLEDVALTAEWYDHAEYHEARMATPRERAMN